MDIPERVKRAKRLKKQVDYYHGVWEKKKKMESAKWRLYDAFTYASQNGRDSSAWDKLYLMIQDCENGKEVVPDNLLKYNYFYWYLKYEWRAETKMADIEDSYAQRGHLLPAIVMLMELPPFELLKRTMAFGNEKLPFFSFFCALYSFYKVHKAEYCLLEELFELFKEHGFEFEKAGEVSVLMLGCDASSEDIEMAKSYGVKFTS